MKIAAIYPVGENEEKFLQLSVQSVQEIVDLVIILFDKKVSENSKQNCLKFLKSFNSKIYFLDESHTRDTNAPREELLKISRSLNISHFLWLDCDEIFYAKNKKEFKKKILKLNIGQKIFLKWINLWENYDLIRVDIKSQWTNTFKDFIVNDDPTYNFNISYHEQRTQGPNLSNYIKVNNDEACVYHLQWLPWENCQYKQAWYMLNELKNKYEKNAMVINRKYYESIYQLNPKLKKIKIEEKLKGVDLELLKGIKYFKQLDNWEKKFNAFFENNNIDDYKNLNVWHLDILKNLYLTKKGHQPGFNFKIFINNQVFLTKFYLRFLKKLFSQII